MSKKPHRTTPQKKRKPKPVSAKADPAIKRGEAGKFLPGTKPGPGNPHASKVQRIKDIILNTVTPEDVVSMCRAMVKKAASGKTGSVEAFNSVMTWMLGKPQMMLTINNNGGITAAAVFIQNMATAMKTEGRGVVPPKIIESWAQANVTGKDAHAERTDISSP